MFDAREFGFNVCGADQIAVFVVSKVEFDSGPEAVVQRRFINRRCAISTVVGGGMKVPRRIHMRAIVGRQGDRLHRPAFAIGQVRSLQSRKKVRQTVSGFGVVAVGHLRTTAGMITVFVIVDGYGQIDKTWHGALLSLDAEDAITRSANRIKLRSQPLRVERAKKTPAR